MPTRCILLGGSLGPAPAPLAGVRSGELMGRFAGTTWGVLGRAGCFEVDATGWGAGAGVWLLGVSTGTGTGTVGTAVTCGLWLKRQFGRSQVALSGQGRLWKRPCVGNMGGVGHGRRGRGSEARGTRAIREPAGVCAAPSGSAHVSQVSVLRLKHSAMAAANVQKRRKRAGSTLDRIEYVPPLPGNALWSSLCWRTGQTPAIISLATLDRRRTSLSDLERIVFIKAVCAI